MINLILTQVCNRQCRYCFARDMLNEGQSQGFQYMGRDLFEQALDLAERSRAPEIRFLGGEPTLHPQFIEFAQSALARRIKLVIFSNGLIPDGPLEFLCSLQPKQVGLLINVNDEPTYRDGEYPRLLERLGRLGRKVTCGYNISQPDFNLEPIIRLIPKLGLYPSIRLGVAHPILSGQNQFLRWEDARTVALRILDAARLADPCDIIMGLDCGFTLCMFKDFYDEVINLRLNFRCTCRPVLDLTPDGKMWYCLALWGHPQSLHITSCPDLEAFREQFEAQFDPMRRFGMLEDCVDCKFRRTGQCSGGCLSRILKQWH
jgi:radical SAM protein with 4Fe4S-binding SPASM domain